MKKVDKNILERYFEGKCSAEEKEEVKTWFIDERYYSALKVAWSDKFNEIINNDKLNVDNDELQSILNSIHHKLNIRLYKRSYNFSAKKLLNSVAMIAAGLFIPLLLFSGWFFIKYSGLSNDLGMAELMAPRGARIHFSLPDGTQGWLNSESVISYPIAFNGNVRNVKLIGEAYFDVFKDHTRPFIVEAENIDVEVLGTKFDINSYKDNNDVQVTLLSGIVKINKRLKGDKKIVISTLKPGEHIIVSKSDASFKKSKVENPLSLTVWKDGKLVLRNDPLDVVIKKLGRWYNVEFIIKDKSLLEYRYHATFQYESLDEVLKLLKLTSPIDYKIVKRQKLADGTYTRRKIILFAKKNVKLN